MRAYTIRTRTVFGPSKYIKVDSSAGSLSMPWDDHLDETENHVEALEELARQLGWHGRYVRGQLDTTGYIFVKLDPYEVFEV
jgi:hypothetical protein